MLAGLFVKDIQRETAAYYGLPVEVMWAEDGAKGTRARNCAWARQDAMALSRRLTDKGFSTLGRLFNRDHSTVITGIREAEARCLTDAATKQAMRTITMNLLGRAR